MNKFEIMCSRCCGVFLETNEKFDPSFVTGDMITLKPEHSKLEMNGLLCPSCGNELTGRNGRFKRIERVGEIEREAITGSGVLDRIESLKDISLFGHEHCKKCGDFEELNYDNLCDDCASGRKGQQGHCNLTRTTIVQKEYTSKELAQSLGCSESSIRGKREQLKNFMRKEGRKNIYSQKAFDYLSGD